jgi:hypothetical protein
MSRLIPVVLLFATLGAAQAGSNRLYLLAQYDWAAKRGFYLDFENSTAADEPCPLKSLRLILGLADGQTWRFRAATPTWEFGRVYRVKAVFDGAGGELWLDGASQGRFDGGCLPSATPVEVADTPGWVSAPTQYIIAVEHAAATGGQPALDFKFPARADLPSALRLFSADIPGRWEPWTLAAGATVTLEASFHLEALPSAHQAAPLIDPYGQCRPASFPGKILNDDQLRADAAAEPQRLAAMGDPVPTDRYGGRLDAPWSEPATGFYRLVRHGGAGPWWLITPDGHPCFYLGMCTAPGLTWETTPVTGREWLFEWLPPRSGQFAAAWGHNAWGEAEATDYVCFHTANMARALGPQWAAEDQARCRQRLRAWGFSGIAKWGGLDGLPVTPVLGHGGVPNLIRHFDPWDEPSLTAIERSVRHQIGGRLEDPFVVGWSMGNEYDEIITRDEIVQLFARPADSPARRALTEVARARGADPAHLAPADIEALREAYEERYQQVIHETIKRVDPHHLYLGYWIVPGWWEDESDWRIAARHCDAVGYDFYHPTFSDERLARLIREADKPVLCGEFSFPPTYGGQRGFGHYAAASADDDAAAGESYQRYVAAAAANPWCVGACWFEYRDQPLTGRGPGHGEALIYSEHYAFGVMDVTNRPKWDLVARMRTANLAAVPQRLTLPAAAAAP